MEKFRELCIKVAPKETMGFFSAVDSVLKKGWKRAVAAEKRARSIGNLKRREDMAYYL